MTNKPSIYVACLASYNSGRLHGRWIDATQDLDDIWSEIREMLAESDIDEVAEEWAIHDYDEYGDLRLGEYESIETVHKIALFIEEHGKLGIELINEFDSVEEAEKVFSEGRYLGCYESLADYAREITEETVSGIPDYIGWYIDYKQMADDFVLNGDIITIQLAWQEVHIIAGH